MINRKQVDLEEFLEEIDSKWKLTLNEVEALKRALLKIKNNG